jgi:hypothetical protein
MAADWYLARGGQERVGPLTSQQLRQMAANGQVSGNDLVWKEGMPNWVPASQVKGLLGGSGPSQAFATQQAPAPADYPEVTEAVEPSGPADYGAEDRGRRGEAGEPWYYGFLERFAKIFMWVGLALVIVVFLYGLFQAISLFSYSVLMGLVLLLVTFIGSGIYVLLILMWTALVLLIVDAGRSLRSINRKVGKT